MDFHFGGEAKDFTSVSELGLAVNLGLTDFCEFVDKFGENPDIDTGTFPEDIWEFGGDYVYDEVNTAPIINIVSDSALDTMVVSVLGLDIDGFQVSQEVTLDGTANVPLSTPLFRVYRMANEGNIDIDGTIYCHTSATNVPAPNEVRAIIDNGNNQTLMALYTVPRGKVGFLFRGELGGSRSQNNGAIQCAYYSRRFNKTFVIKKRVDITNQGTSVYVDKRTAPDIIPGITDIKLRVEEVSANNTGAFGTFDIMLVDQKYFSKAYLTGIGQPYPEDYENNV